MKYIAFVLTMLFSFFGCQQNPNNQQLNDLKSELEKANKALTVLQSENDYALVHLVYFKLKEGANKTEFIKEIEKLEAIEQVEDLQYGEFKDLGDARAMSQFDIAMRMGFDSEADYAAYQAHPIHLNLKKAVGAYLAAPPATYDFSVVD